MAAVPPAPAAPGGCLLAAAVIASQHYKMLRPHPDAGAGQDSPAALKRRRLAAGLGTKGGLGRGDDDGTQQHSATAEAEAVVGLEVCIDCVSSARTAAAAGARSVELCAALVDGGTTPSIGMVRQVVRAVGGLNGVAVQVIIRPRGGDFLYSEDEEAVMLGDIAAAKEAGADGVVIGALTPDGEVDLPLTGRLIAAARPELAVTFHRAIDLTAEPLRALDQLLPLGVERVLSSGGAASAPEGLETLRRMQEAADKHGHTVVVPGGGLTVDNVARVVAATKVHMVHASLRTTKNGGMLYRKPGVFMGGEKTNTPNTEFEGREADSGLVQRVVACLRTAGRSSAL